MMLQVVGECSDTLTVYDEIVNWEADNSCNVSDATAKTLASWYSCGPMMLDFSYGLVVSALPLRYEVVKAQQYFIDCPGDLLNIAALLSWINSKLLTVR